MNRPIVLASQSPRRRELIQVLNRPVSCVSADLDEPMNDDETPEAVVLALAFEKVMAAYKQNEGIANAEQSIWIGSDTIVAQDGIIYGKPVSDDHAEHMLKQLSGKTHQVLTGVALYVPELKLKYVFYERTEVTFRELDQALIDWYIASGEHRDKAGSYGIQQLGARLVRGIKGDFFNVMGLPVAAIDETLKQLAL